MKVKSTKKNILFITISILTVLVIFTTIGLVLYFKFNPQKKQQTVYDYTLTINSNGGSDGSVTEFTAQNFSTHSFTLPEMWSDSLPTKLNFELIGFADTSDATTPQYKLGENVILTSDNPEKTIYAVWRKPLLMNGNDFNDILKTGNFTNLVFGSFDKYKDFIVSFKNEYIVDADGNGTYKIYTTDSTIYVLSKVGNIIYAGDCSNMFNSSSVSRYDFTDFDTSLCTSMSGMFSECSSLTSLDLSLLNTSSCTNMSSMFSGCSGLTELNLLNFDTSNVTDMSGMFNKCSSLTSLDLSLLNTSSCTDMSSMFSGCSALTELNLLNFDTSNVTDISSMFSGCSSLPYLILTNFNNDNITDYSNMFKNCSNLTTIYSDYNFNVNTSVSTDMFDGCANLIGSEGTTFDSNHTDISYAQIDGGTLSPGYFTPIPVLKTGIEVNSIIGTDTTKIIFGKLEDYNAEIVSITSTPLDTENKGVYSLYKVGTVVYILTSIDYKIVLNQNSSKFFYKLGNLTSIENISAIETNRVINIDNFFSECTSLVSLDLSSFDTSSCTNMNSMFNTCTALSSLNVSSFNTDNVIYMASMFKMTALTSIDLSSFNTANVADMMNLFSFSPFTALNLENFDTRNVTNMSSMFASCSSLISLDLSNFNTEKVTNMYGMFYKCSSLTSLNLSSFDTGKVEKMSYMFAYCSSLTSLDLSSFDTDSCTNISRMFSDCSNLTTIYASDAFVTDNATSSANLFINCKKLVGGEGTTYTSYADKTYARIDGGASAPGYFTLKNS